MTYGSWREDFFKKRNTIVDRLKKFEYSQEEIIDYFEYENMAERESNFCPLYKLERKCHNVEYLNCYHCACPHFMLENENSYCEIDSKFADNIVINNNKICDCTNCVIPHTKKFNLKHKEEI